MLKRITPLCLSLILSGCTFGAAQSSPTHASRPVPQLAHVFLIVLENREYDPAGDPPYLASLRRSGAGAVHSYAILHPSLPNYLALFSGQTFGVVSDHPGRVFDATTLADQLDARRLTWKAYMDGMPTACFKGDTAGTYAMKHDPFMYFTSIRDNPARCRKVTPLTSLRSDLRRNRVPNFSWITPDLCHDGHDCDLKAVDAFLRGLVPQITASHAFHNRGVLFITYDEGSSIAGCCQYAFGGRIETIAVGGGIPAGRSITAPIDHYSLLRTIEDGFRLKRLAHAACPCTASLAAAWGK